jgi:AcrR family transcriptional regulator
VNDDSLSARLAAINRTVYTGGVNTRALAKASRRQALVEAAARLFAERGFDRVTLEDIGGAAGISGPAVYRHFAGKQAVLAAILLDASEGLLEGGREVLEQAPDAGAALRELVTFHVAFAVGNAAVIRVQDRDLDSLAEPDRRHVRTLQRTYVELWVDVLARLSPEASVAELRSRAHAAFGLMNSTPHTGRGLTPEVLARMALAALTAG